MLLGKAFGLAALWLAAPLWLFLVIAIYLYVKSQNSLYKLFGLFFVTLVLTWVADYWLSSGIENTPLVDSDFLLRTIFSVLFGILFFIIFGIKELFFVRRREFCLVATTLSFLLATFFTLWSYMPGMIVIRTIPFALAAFILGYTLTRFVTNNFSMKSTFIYFFIVTYLMTELLWVLSYAPFSIISSSIILTVSFFVINSLYLIFPGSESARIVS
ncbi:MAG: hypothetical protein Q8L47_04895 [bacterium]|nr:hypothetical protein [bacterium]